MAVNGIEIGVGQKWVTTKDRVVQVVAPAVGWVRDSVWKPEFVLDDGYYVSNDGKLSTPWAESLVHKVGALWYKAPQQESGKVFPDISEAMREAGQIRLRLFPDTSAADGAIKALMDQVKAEVANPQRRDTDKKDASGGGKLDRKSNYYQVHIQRPVDAESDPYMAECADIIEALNMTFNEGEAFKALWRLAAARLGKTKAGGNPIYDADKAAHYGVRTAAQTRAQQVVTK